MDTLDEFSMLSKFVHGSTVGEARVVEAESELGVLFPAQYRRLLLKWGWGWWEPGNSLYGLPSPGDHPYGSDANCVLATLRERAVDHGREGPFGREGYARGRLPHGDIVIGEDGGGGIFVLRTAPAEEVGQVVWRDCEGDLMRWPDLDGYLRFCIQQSQAWKAAQVESSGGAGDGVPTA